MTLNKILLLSFLTIFISCNGQEKANTVKEANSTKPSPKVIRNFKAIGLAPDFDTTLVSQYIRSIFQDSKGNLWFGTFEGIVRYDEKTLTYFSNPEGFISQSVFAINEDKNGNLWIGTDQGVYKYDGKVFKNYNPKDGLNHIDISRKGILVDQSGTIWVGTHGGVYRYDPILPIARGGKVFHYFNNFRISIMLASWKTKVATFGLLPLTKVFFAMMAKRLSILQKRRELRENYAGGIAQDNAGNMWFTMKNGICKYDGKTLTEYTSKDGLGGSRILGHNYRTVGYNLGYNEEAAPQDLALQFTLQLIQMRLKCLHLQTVLLVAFKVCFKTNQEECGGAQDKDFTRFDGKHFYQVKQIGPW